MHCICTQTQRHGLRQHSTQPTLELKVSMATFFVVGILPPTSCCLMTLSSVFGCAGSIDVGEEDVGRSFNRDGPAARELLQPKLGKGFAFGQVRCFGVSVVSGYSCFVQTYLTLVGTCCRRCFGIGKLSCLQRAASRQQGMGQYVCRTSTAVLGQQLHHTVRF